MLGFFFILKTAFLENKLRQVMNTLRFSLKPTRTSVEVVRSLPKVRWMVLED